MDTTVGVCNNCYAPTQGKFCHHCGQKAHVGRLKLHDIFHELWHALTHTDKGILKLLLDLALRPADVYTGYFSGQRKKYFSPVLFFLVTAGTLAVLYPYIFDYEDKVVHQYNEFGRILYHMVKYRALMLLPLQVVLTWVVFKKRFNLAEITVFWLFCLGFGYAVKIVALPLYFPFIRHKIVIDNVLNIAFYLIMIWHGMAALGNKKWANLIGLFILVNIFWIADGVLQVYLALHDHPDLLHKYGYDNFWNVIKQAYTW